MPSIRLTGLGAASGAELHLDAGWTGVVGATRADELAFLAAAVRVPDIRLVRRCAALPDAVQAALADAPDLLVVDGPGDEAARPTLLDLLRNHRGVGLIATRDRALLDDLTSSTVRVEHGVPRLYAGNYAAARAAWQAEGEARGRARAESRRQARAIEQATQDAAGLEGRAAQRFGRGKDVAVRPVGVPRRRSV